VNNASDFVNFCERATALLDGQHHPIVREMIEYVLGFLLPFGADFRVEANNFFRPGGGRRKIIDQKHFIRTLQYDSKFRDALRDYCGMPKFNGQLFFSQIIKLIEDVENRLDIVPENNRNKAGVWATNTDDYKTVSQTDKIEMHRTDLGSSKILIVLEGRKAIGIVTNVDLRKMNAPGLTYQDQISKIMTSGQLIRFSEDTHMQQIYGILMKKGERDIRQVIIDKKDGDFLGIVSIGEATDWHEGLPPPSP
jgi:CBS domain-containing protein